ncbi:MAG: PilN domain-containing protein [Planctomycetes bacterium]|nr:PilN domain-containing protein [Planctomycetota bacterium]
MTTTAAQSGRNGRPTRVAAVHAQGDRLRLVVLSTDAQPEVLEAVDLPLGQAGDVCGVIKRHNVDFVVAVAPARQCVCRCVDMPGAGDDPGDAISLLLETQLPGDPPAHRRAGGVVRGGVNGQRVALLTGWIDRDGAAVDWAAIIDPACWVAEVASIEALRTDRKGLLAHADQSAGTISVFAAGEKDTAARVLVEDGSNQDVWRQAVVRAIEETAAAAGLDTADQDIRARDIVLVMSASDRAALSAKMIGIDPAAAWLDTFGVALGAALVAGSAHANRRGLAGLSLASRAVSEPALVRAAGWLAQPRNALVTCMAAIVLMLMTPLTFAWGRAALLEHKADAAKQHELQQRERSRSAAVYGELNKSYWPVTKLLSDISRAAPMGVEVDQVTIAPQQGSVLIEGRAELLEDVHTFRGNLNDSGVFERAQTARTQGTDDGTIEFSLTANVGNAHVLYRGEQDFAARTLAQQLYQEDDASNLNWTPSSGSDSIRRAPVRSRRAEARNDGSDRRPASTAKPAGDIPPPLTPEQLQSTDRTALMKAKVARYTALRKVEDEEAKNRLQDELNQLDERLNALRAGGTP